MIAVDQVKRPNVVSTIIDLVADVPDVIDRFPFDSVGFIYVVVVLRIGAINIEVKAITQHCVADKGDVAG